MYENNFATNKYWDSKFLKTNPNTKTMTNKCTQNAYKEN